MPGKVTITVEVEDVYDSSSTAELSYEEEFYTSNSKFIPNTFRQALDTASKSAVRDVDRLYQKGASS